MRVELGAGARARRGWLALDVNPNDADVVASALALPFRDGSIEQMRAVDVLEHISYRDTEKALREWGRVCAPDAELYVQVPDADTIMRWYADDDARLKRWTNFQGREDTTTLLMGAQWRLLGGHDDRRYVDSDDGSDWRWNAHYSLWDAPSLKRALARAGFEVVKLTVNGHPNLLCTARRT